MRFDFWRVKKLTESNEPPLHSWLQYVAAITSTLGIVTCGMHYGWSSPSIPILLRNDSYIHLTDDEGSWIAVTPLISEVAAGLITPFFVNQIGRKYTILLSAPIYIISWTTIALAKSFAIMMCGRSIAGIGDNIVFSTIPIYLSEIADPRIRGALGSSVPVALYLGTLLINTIGSFLTIPTMAWVATVLPILQLITFVWIPESPYYYLMKGRLEEARSSLKQLRRMENVDDELDITAKAVQRQQEEPGTLWDLYKIESNRKALLIAIGLRTTQQLTGVTAFMFYTQYIFDQSGQDISPHLSAIIYNGLQLVLSVIASGLVDKLGRRPMLIFSCVGSAVALALEAVYFYLKEQTDFDVSSVFWLPIFAMLLFIFVYSLGYSTIPVLMNGELFPTSVKAFALTFMDVYFSVIAAIITKLFQFSGTEFGMHVPFIFFTICTVCSIFFCIYCVPETKGLHLEDIQMNLKGMNSKKNKHIKEYCTKF